VRSRKDSVRGDRAVGQGGRGRPIYALRKKTPGVIFAIAAIGVAAVYWKTLAFGFQYDDYHFVRPWTWGEWVQTLHGSWDPTKIESDFYRPLTAAWFALRFELIGLNGVAAHAISLAAMIACAWLAGVFVGRETGSDRAAFFASGLYAIHPAFAYSQAVWLTNQMHLMASVIVLASLLEWQRVRDRPAAAWWPLVLLQLAGFGVKEDLVMLAPLLVTLTVLRRLLRGDAPFPPWLVVIAGILLPAGCFWLRYVMLGRLGGYGPPPHFDQAWTNFITGLLGVFRQVPARRPWQAAASTFSQTILVAGAIGSVVRRREAHLLATGIAVALFFDAPFVFVAKAEQYHLVALGVVLALTGAIEVIASLVPQGLARVGVTATVAAASLSFLPPARSMANDFAPCSPITLRTDAIVLDWWVVPPEIQDWLRDKPAACRGHRLVSLPGALMSATWAYGADVDAQGRRSQWTSDHAVVMLAPRVSDARVGLWSPVASAEHEVTVRLRGSGADAAVRLTNDEWQADALHLSATPWSWPRRMNRVDVAISPTFVPAEIDRESRDRRQLGVRIRIEDLTVAR
jgi:hypothetical protein